MSRRTVFRWDLLDVRRSRLGLGVALTIFGLTAGIAVVTGLVALTDPTGTAGLSFGDTVAAIAFVASLFLPFVAMLASYSAVVHEREHGSIRFLMGLPNSRSDAYVGKLASRSVLFVLPTLISLAVVAVIGVATFPDVALGTLAAVSLLLLVYGLVFTGFGLSLSAVVDNETGATSGIIGVWMIFRFGWMGLQYGLQRLLIGENFPQEPTPDWYYWIGRTNPMNAYGKLVYEALGTPNNPGNRILITVPEAHTDTVATTDWFAALVLLAWLGLAPLLGYLKFRNTDLL